LNKALKGVDEKSSDDEEKEIGNEENEALDDFGDEQTKQLFLDQKIYTGLYKDCVFWISREVPKDSLEFIIKSFGGKAGWDGEGSPIKSEEDESITHQIVDRGTVPKNKIISRDYVQPQYVYDCINAKTLLPTDKYMSGEKLPPHLSPFVDYDKEGYIPDYKKEIDYYYNKSIGVEVENFQKEPEIVKEEDEVSDEELDEERYERELKAEKKKEHTRKKKKKKKKKRHQKKRKRDIDISKKRRRGASKNFDITITKKKEKTIAKNRIWTEKETG